MEGCLSQVQISEYASGQLPASEKLRLNKHLSQCDRCRELVFSNQQTVRAATMVLGRFEKTRQPCPSKRMLLQYVDGELPADYGIRVADHARACRWCNDIIAELRRVRQDRLDLSSVGEWTSTRVDELECTLAADSELPGQSELYAILVRMTGGRGQEPFKISRPYTKLGRVRSDQACIVVDDRAVSEPHCKITVERDEDGTVTGITVEDMQSRNGTWVNGKLVTKAVLEDRDMIRVGDTEFLFLRI